MDVRSGVDGIGRWVFIEVCGMLDMHVLTGRWVMRV